MEAQDLGKGFCCFGCQNGSQRGKNAAGGEAWVPTLDRPFHRRERRERLAKHHSLLVVCSRNDYCYDIEAHYPEFQPPFTADVAAINATLSSLATRLTRRFERNSEATPGEERKLYAAGRAILNDSLDLKYDLEYVGEELISLRSTQSVYFSGAAHPNSFTHTFNFKRHPFMELDIFDLFGPYGNRITEISDYCIAVLIAEKQNTEYPADEKWVRRGAAAHPDRFSKFLLSPTGLRIIFDPYEVSSYAEGRREVFIPPEVVSKMVASDISDALWPVRT